MMSIPFFTSFLFIVPMVYAWLVLPKLDVAVACLICLTTSIGYHYDDCQNETWRVIDTVVVRLIATAYIIHAVVTMGWQKPWPLYLFAATTLLVYLGLSWHKDNKEKEVLYKCHSFVHLFAVCGIMLYIYYRSRYLKV